MKYIVKLAQVNLGDMTVEIPATAKILGLSEDKKKIVYLLEAS